MWTVGFGDKSVFVKYQFTGPDDLSQAPKNTPPNNHTGQPINLAVELGACLDRAGEKPLFIQLCHEICQLILSQRLGSGTKLPGSRAMASDLGLSRTTVLSAYDQLEAEGYIEARRGAGVFVVEGLSEGLGDGIEPVGSQVPVAAQGEITLSSRSAGLIRPKTRHSEITAFDYGKPDLDSFPFEQWSRILAKCWRRPAPDLLYGYEYGGYARLREQIALYLGSNRGLVCDPDQVILTSSTHEAIEVLSQVLLEAGEEVWIEDPAYFSALQAFVRAGVKPVSVRVDEEGFSLARAMAIAPAARLAFITPSRQFPLGQTMSLNRRLALIDWARTHNAWLVEDDYDSEYRYRGQPLQPLAARDGFERTIYLGSFSKVMFPALRLSYMVAPKGLVDPLLAVFQSTGKQASILVQPALSEFMASGQFAQHIRRSRRLYGKRHAALQVALEAHGQDLFKMECFDSGMHIVAHFRAPLTSAISDIDAALYLRQHQLITNALSQYFHTSPKRQGLVLGFAAVPENEIAANVVRLTELLRNRL